ncbi:MAG: hypothetical protein JRG91_18310 [Deltaproteobacteria bacterium]|nr:hypothetical protein [Deltaproteobacteria bacterium]
MTLVIMQVLRSLLAVAGIASLSGGLLAATPLPAEPGFRLEGLGAAGVAEVGRPLDVLRGRAEARARARAVDALVLSANLLAAGQDTHHTVGRQAGGLEEKARARATAETAIWHLHYWSNGAVTARVTLPREEILDEVTVDE